MSTDIKVSVCVVTYNQEKYIAECLQSLVDQVTDFPFEIIVGEDCSTDRTREIVLEFQKKYPDIVKPLLHEKNVGGSENYLKTHAQAVGKYIAHMDGDDYALPGKLQVQADFLDNNKECNLLWTPVYVMAGPNVLYEQNKYFHKHALERVYLRADLIKYGTLGTNSSKMYRRNIRQEIPLPSFGLIDYFVNAIQVGDGVACFSGTNPLGVYRIGIGIASNGRKTRNMTLESIKYLYKKYPQYRLECNIAALFHLIRDIKNTDPGTILSLKLFVTTFHFKSFAYFIRELKFMRSLTVENKND